MPNWPSFDFLNRKWFSLSYAENIRAVYFSCFLFSFLLQLINIREYRTSISLTIFLLQFLKTVLAFFRNLENDKTPFSLFLEMHSIFSLSQFFIIRVFHLLVCNLKWTQILENENWKCFYKVNMPLNVLAYDFFSSLCMVSILYTCHFKDIWFFF
jgi:hypothetical protein